MPKKTKVPKMIAGVKVPKALRRGLRDLAASETGRAALKDVLDAAAAALAVAETAPASKRRKKTAAPASAAAALESAGRAFTETLSRQATTDVVTPPAIPPAPAVTH